MYRANDVSVMIQTVMELNMSESVLPLRREGRDSIRTQRDICVIVISQRTTLPVYESQLSLSNYCFNLPMVITIIADVQLTGLACPTG